MEFNMEWTQVCRICLQEGEMESIFDNSINIYEKLMQCSSININRNVNLPKQICKNCLQDLEIAYKFHTNCESSDAILKSYIDTTTNLNGDSNSIFIKSYKFCPPAGLKVRRINGKSAELLKSNLMIDLNVKQNDEPNICPNENDDYVEENKGDNVENDNDDDVKQETQLPTTIVYNNVDQDDCGDDYDDDDDEDDVKVGNDQTLLLISDNIDGGDSNFIDRDDYIEFLIHGDLDKDIGSVGDGGNDDEHLSNQKYILSIKNEINNEIINENDENIKPINFNEMEMMINDDSTNINLINNVKYLIEDCKTPTTTTPTTTFDSNNIILNDYEQTITVDTASILNDEEIMHIKPVRFCKNLRYGKSQLDGSSSSGGESKAGGGGSSGDGNGGDVVRDDEYFDCNTNNINSKENIQILTKDILYDENMPVYRLKNCTTSQINQRNNNKPLRACEICGNQYKHQHALESHMRRHRNEKPFKCEICGKAFVINFELNRHKRTHTGQKPYACKYCDRRFSDFGSRIKHERTHTGERPYKCLTCGKSFAYSHVLNSHNLTHTGEKKYHCEKCGKRFTKSHHLKAHMNTHDRNRPSKVLVPTTGDDTKIIQNQLDSMEIINENGISDIGGDIIGLVDDNGTVVDIIDDHHHDNFVDDTTIIGDDKFRKYSLQYSTNFDINDVTNVDALMILPD